MCSVHEADDSTSAVRCKQVLADRRGCLVRRLTFELRRDRRYCAATIKSCTSHRRGAMPLGLASSEWLGLDFRRATRLTGWRAWSDSVSDWRGLFGRRRKKGMCSFLPPKREEASSAIRLPAGAACALVLVGRFALLSCVQRALAMASGTVLQPARCAEADPANAEGRERCGCGRRFS